VGPYRSTAGQDCIWTLPRGNSVTRFAKKLPARHGRGSAVNIAILLVAFLPALLVAAAICDLTSYTIPNIVPASMILLFITFLAAMGLKGHPLDWSSIGLHFLAGFIGLVAGMAVFAAGWVGGGDAKLFAAVALWFGWNDLFDYAILATLLGGCLTIFLIAIRRVSLPQILADQPWIARLADRKEGVPYGVALAVAALTVLPDTELFRLAATS
jgi:prepilin peptidase CpaA